MQALGLTANVDSGDPVELGSSECESTPRPFARPQHVVPAQLSAAQEGPRRGAHQPVRERHPGALSLPPE